MTWRTCGLYLTLLVLGVTAAAGPAEAVNVPGDFPTIQAAINAVHSGALANGTVIDLFPGGTYYERLSVNFTAKSLTIRSAGAPATINASGSGSAIAVVQATGMVRFENLIVTGGAGGPGAGGGLVAQDASPVFSNVTFQNNAAISGGGAYLTRSNAIFSDCKFLNNTATHFGGALAMTLGSRPVFVNCWIQGNISGTASNVGSGGALHANDTSPTFIGSTITGNRSSFGGGGLILIGPFGSVYGTSILTLEDCDVSDNVTTRFGPADNPAEGGGVHIEDNTVGRITRTTIRRNVANTGGGLNAFRARYEVTGSVIEGNQAPDPQNIGGFGGGISAFSDNASPPERQAVVILTDSIVRNNSSRIGGGIITIGDLPTARATLTVQNSVVDSNTATGGGGGGIIADRTSLTLTRGQISRNRATGGSAPYGGGLLVVSGPATISDTVIAGNSAVQYGGGLFVDLSANITVQSSTIYKNSAGNTGGGIFVGGNGPPTGSVQNSALVDNVNFAIAELCPPSPTVLTYTNNTITTNGTSSIYNAMCGGVTLNLAGFNAANNTSGNVGSLTLTTAQARAYFGATPDSTPSVLAWTVMRASSVSINPGGISGGDIGTADVTVGANTTFTLNAPTSVGTVTLTTGVTGPPVQFGAFGDRPVPGDFDGDGKYDLAVMRPTTAEWFISGSATGFEMFQFGAPSLGDVAVPRDYDGDGITDLAVYRLSTAEWFIFGSATGFTGAIVLGSPGFGDIPMPADYDGDGKTDLGVFRQSTGEWLYFGSSVGFPGPIRLGNPALGDVPVPADYDGDGIADLAVYRLSTAEWFIFGSATGFTGAIVLGSPAHGDVPVPADYDGDGKADLAVRRTTDSTFYIFASRDGFMTKECGAPTDIPVPGNYDGAKTPKSRFQPAVWRPGDGTWIAPCP